jgi:hypothetical protein
MQRRRSPQEDGAGQEAAGGLGTLTTDANLVVLACNNFVLFFFHLKNEEKENSAPGFELVIITVSIMDLGYPDRVRK